MAEYNRFPGFDRFGTTLARPGAGAVPPGTLYFNTTLGTLQQSDGTAVWANVSPAAGGIAVDPAWTAAGQIIQATGVGTAAVLNIGTAGQALRVNAGATALAYADFSTAGTLAARPAAAAGNTGSLYFATDIGAGILYRSTGAAWVPVSTSAAVEMAAVTTFTGNGQAAGTDVTLWAPVTIPAASMAVGTTYIINVTCDFDIINTITARNLVFKLKLGATTIWSASYVVLVSVAQTNQPLFIPIQFEAAVAGAGGTIRSQTVISGFEGIVANNTPRLVTGGSTGTNAVAVDLSAAQAVALTVNESVNSVADVIRAQTGTLIVAGA